MRRNPPRPDPATSALPTSLVVLSVAALALFVGQVLLTPAVLAAVLGVAAAAVTAAGAALVTRWTLVTVLDSREDEESPPSTVDPRPTE